MENKLKKTQANSRTTAGRHNNNLQFKGDIEVIQWYPTF